MGAGRLLTLVDLSASVSNCWRCRGVKDTQLRSVHRPFSGHIHRNQPTSCYGQPRKSGKVSSFQLRSTGNSK